MTTSRRGFLGGFAAALAGFSILPAATTYTRLWKAVKVPRWIVNPAYDHAPFESGIAHGLTGKWEIVLPVGWWEEHKNDPHFEKLGVRYNEVPPLFFRHEDKEKWTINHSILRFMRV